MSLRLVVAAVLGLSLNSAVAAQSLWFDLPLAPSANAAGTVAIQPVQVPFADLQQLKVGDRIEFQLGAKRYQAILTSQQQAGSSRTLLGHLDEPSAYPLVLTLSADRLFARLTTELGSYNLSADAQQGQLVASHELQQQIDFGQTDSLTPNYPKPAVARARSISRNGLTLDQTFKSQQVLIGQNIEGKLSLTNTSAVAQTGVKINLYFVVETTSLVSASAGCSLVTSGQKRLECNIGTLNAGASRSFDYVLATSQASHGSLDAAAIVSTSTDTSGALREDDFIEVLQDTTTDSDGDGLSNFNEGMLGTDPNNAASVSSQKAVIDIMAVYTPGASALYPGAIEARLQHLVAVTNSIYQQSQVGIRMRLVHSVQANYSDNTSANVALTALTGSSPPSGKDPAFSQVDALRQQYGADMVVLFRPYRNDGTCGLAWTNGIDRLGDLTPDYIKDYAFSLVSIDCDDDVLAHETGHNLGLGHSHRQNDQGTFPYSVGYGIDNQFVTLMAYQSAFNGAAKINKFSSPSLDCNGVPCGIVRTAVEGSDSVFSLNAVRFQAANFMPTQVPDLISGPVRQDYDGDGKSDIWVRHLQTGQNYLFMMNGDSIASQGLALTVPVNWQLAAFGDFNLDAKTDNLWRNQNTGDNVLLLQNGLDSQQEIWLPTVADPNWKLVAFGDFDGNDYADLYWYHQQTGLTVFWLFNAQGQKQEKISVQLSDLNWQIAGVGDLNGDKRQDLIWQHQTSGLVYYFLMQADGSFDAQPGIQVPTGWSIQAVGDLDGDGFDDLFWRHSQTGQNEIHRMQGNQLLEAKAFMSIAPAWSIGGYGDYNGDGKLDLNWFNAGTGQSYLFLMNNASLMQEASLGSWNSSEWRLVR